ncbi:uncharacterized protein LOC135951181 [Calliphora vicina]|uniref:uncharacterized protein LOC135951181 n=1 Tax=Calliphora vicina TaxID=7373 RepID=UPI00325B2AB3
MPRLLAAEYVYSGALDDGYNDYVTTTTPPPTIAHAAQQHIETAPQTRQHQIPTIAMPSNTITARSMSPVAEGNANTPPQPSGVKLPEQIHTISSSDEEEFVEQNTIEDEITNISSDESGDFEGFDDYTTPNSSGLINDASQEDLNISSNYLKRHSQIDYNEYREDSEGVVEAIEVDDEDEEIAIGDDGQIIYKSREEITPTKTQTYRYEPHTPNKRQKQETERHYNAISPTQLKTPPDQIVEVNSDSTTNSLKQKRQQINTKFQLNLSQQQNHKVNNNPNKCSTESTSEFPVSSPSNPQQPRGGKYPPRPPLLKNTLPADSFERQLAMITACNPQMTLAEKIQTWDCDEELSDVEDVNMFDEEFKRVEKQKKLDIKQREKSGRIKNTEIKIYDFLAFRQMLLRNMKEQKNQKYVSGQSGGGGFGVSGNKCIESSGSESSKSVIHVDDRPTTSAVAQQQLQQRRSKPQINLETGEPKKRLVKEAPKRNQNSTTPPQTSSSDNDRDCFQNSKNQAAHNKLNSRQIHLHGKLCPSSSEEAISQDVPAHVLLKTNNKCASANVKNVRKKSLTQPQPPAKSSETTTTLTKNPRIATEEEIDSVFRLHRLNRERDKYNSSLLHEVEEQPSSIIQMRLDFANDTNKTKNLMEKKQELFKTPIIPQKYLANSTLTAENQRQTCLSPTKNVITANEEISQESPQLLNASIKSTEEFKNDSSTEKLEKQTDNDDLAGVYHQQHEFCNYLGLTGMSTATAMANAVAELAQCNLARRSMRVLRQQQQERRDKSAKEEKQLEALKLKQLKELRKRERGGSDVIPVMETEPTANKSDEGSHSQTSEPTTSVQEPKQKTSNNSTTKSSTKSQNSFTIIKNEPEIKILCHIAAKSKDEAAKLSQECVKEITQPIRETLMRQAKIRKSIIKPLEKSEEDEHDEEKNNGNSNTIDNKILQIIKEQKTDCVEEIAMRDMETPKRTLRSPRLSIGKAALKTTKSRSQILNESKETVQNHETSAFVCKLECMGDTMSDIKSVANKCATSCINVEDFIKDEMLEQNSNGDDISLVKTGKHLISSTPSIIQQKLQMALEESRKSKPSIFIVQSLECKKDQAKSLENLHSLNTPLTEVQGHQVIKKALKKSLKVETKFNKNNIKKVLKTHKGKKYPTSKRQLRKRKIIVIKTIKPKQKSYASLNEIKRELRSSPRINEIQRLDSRLHKNVNNKQKYMPNKSSVSNETKSYRTVHTETKDLEIYLDKHNSQTKTRLMAKASALLERSRMTLRGSCKAVINKSKLTSQIKRSKLNFRGSRTQILRPRIDDTTSEKRKFKSISTSAKLLQMPTLQEIVTANKTPELANIPSVNLLENENVVVSSTTNTYDERPSHEPLPTQSPITLRSLHNAASYVIASSPMETKDQFTQCSSNSGVQYLNTAPLPVQTMRNPLKSDHGVVLYMYHELDILIVIQERLVSFWKCSKLINILATLPTSKPACTHNSVLQSETITMPKLNNVEHCCNNQLRQPASSSTLMEPNTGGEWIQLGELRRLNYDFEISVPFANRICLHNSTPIYLEMRAQQLPKNQRDCNLLSMYINIYYYHDEDMIAKCNSIPLDTIQSDIHSVNYTTLIDSRYFIMTWPQENLLGKTRSGLCKYSLTPQLDTLASIREFKSMRHTVRYLECMSDDKLIGFGETQVTIWDHRSGDVLMNFDLEIPMGKNLGSIYFSSQDIEQNNMLILHQFRDFQNDTPPELMTLACTITHAQPSYRVLQEIRLPMPAFKTIKSSINSGDHLVVTGQNDDELWICATNPRLITLINTIENSKRFYNRERSQLIELTEKTLNINTLANHILQLAAGKYEA